MNEKNKAKQVVEKYVGYVHSGSIGLDALYNAKQCALISVNETMEALREFKKGKMFTDSNHIGSTFNYWKSVKKEIEKLKD